MSLPRICQPPHPVKQEQLDAAFQDWAGDRTRTLAEKLLLRGDLDPDESDVVETMIGSHLKKKGGDAAKSLSSLALGGNGFLSRAQFERLRESYKFRPQVVYGLVPLEVDPELIRYVTATARYLASGEQAAVPSS